MLSMALLIQERENIYMIKTLLLINKKQPFLILGIVLIIILSILSFLSLFINTENIQNLNSTLLPIGSNGYVLGSDHLGRSILDRILVGSRISLSIGILASLIALLIGFFLGVLSGFYSGMIDNLIMRFTDVIMSFPTLLLIIAISVTLPNNYMSTIVVIGISSWTSMARLIRSQILRIKSEAYYESAKALGYSDSRIIIKHLIPNCIGPIIIFFTLGISNSIMAESSLSFLGLGVQPPTPTWGGMINEGKNFLRIAHHISTIPGFCICITVLAFNLIGESLRDYLDVKIK